MRGMNVSMRMSEKCESVNKSPLVIRKESKCHRMKCTNKRLMSLSFKTYPCGSLS